MFKNKENWKTHTHTIINSNAHTHRQSTTTTAEAAAGKWTGIIIKHEKHKVKWCSNIMKKWKNTKNKSANNIRH